MLDLKLNKMSERPTDHDNCCVYYNTKNKLSNIFYQIISVTSTYATHFCGHLILIVALQEPMISKNNLKLDF